MMKGGAAEGPSTGWDVVTAAAPSSETPLSPPPWPLVVGISGTTKPLATRTSDGSRKDIVMILAAVLMATGKEAVVMAVDVMTR